MQRSCLPYSNAGTVHRRFPFREVSVALFGLVFFSAVASSDNCEGWGTADYFSTASLPAVSACLEAGTDPNFRDETGLTALHAALQQSLDLDVLRTLLGYGANLSDLTASGWEAQNSMGSTLMESRGTG